MPSSPELYSEEELPQHPMLQLLDNSEQILTSRYGRRLITMVKVKPYDAAAAAEFREQREGYVMALERLTEIVYSSKEELAAAAAAGGSNGSSEGSGQQPVVVPSMPKYRGKGV
jgi:tRNA (guanine10-N2)-methyltransferase